VKKAIEPTYSFVILTLILIVIDTVIAWASVKIFPAIASGVVSWLYIAVAFMILFTLWFGAYGAIAAYVGTLAGSGLLVSETLVSNPLIAVVWAFSGLIQVLIPLVAFRSFGVDLNLPNPRDYAYVFLFCVILNNFVGAVWAAWTLSLVETTNIVSVFSAWFIGNAVVALVLVPIGLKLVTPRIEKHRLFIKNYWD
jgi:hypothetical protein